MAYNLLEISREDGRPVQGYMFVLGDTVWRYTSAAVDIDDGVNIWKAVSISDSGIKQTGESQTDALTITAPVTIGPAQVHMGTPPAQAIQVSIHKVHYGEGAAEMIVAYSGEIVQVGFPMPGQCTVTCGTTSASMQRDGLHPGWQRSCPHAVYDPLTCKVDKVDYAVPMRVTAVTPNTITCPAADAFDNGYFDGGFFTWTHPVRGLEFRGIEAHVGAQLTVFGMTDDLSVGLEFVAYPGCDQLRSTCINKFNNLPNHGGFKYMPGKSPFDGTPVF